MILGWNVETKLMLQTRFFFVSQYVETTLVSLSSTQLKLSRKELVPFPAYPALS